jgi:hypothetical protein
MINDDRTSKLKTLVNKGSDKAESNFLQEIAPQKTIECISKTKLKYFIM